MTKLTEQTIGEDVKCYVGSYKNGLVLFDKQGHGGCKIFFECD